MLPTKSPRAEQRAMSILLSRVGIFCLSSSPWPQQSSTYHVLYVSSCMCTHARACHTCRMSDAPQNALHVTLRSMSSKCDNTMPCA